MRSLAAILIFFILNALPAATLAAATSTATSTPLKIPHRETPLEPNLKRLAPIPDTSTPGTSSQAPLMQTQTLSPQAQTTTTGTNLIQNPSLESAGSNGLPVGWKKGGYGTNTRTLTYPVSPAADGAKAARVDITSYTSGDAKWYFDDVSVAPGTTYTYSDSYKSDQKSWLTARFKDANGTYSYKDIAAVSPATSWTTAYGSFSPPSGTVSVTVFHLIKSKGSLTIDNAALKPADVFRTGAVTFRFDDGLGSQYSTAAPKLDAAGFKGTFYIISHEIYDNGYTGFMSIANVQSLAKRGDEIGAHTQTHPHLTTLSAQEQQNEISGSRTDIQGWGIGSVLSFDYPFGEYDSTTIQAVKNAGFTSAVATITGYVTQSSDPYQLEYQEVNQPTTLAQVEQWVDAAAANHTWLILAFHDVKTGGGYYSTTPTEFSDIVDYVKQKNIPVVTVSQGRQAL